MTEQTNEKIQKKQLSSAEQKERLLTAIRQHNEENGNEASLADMGRKLEVSPVTANKYADILEAEGKIKIRRIGSSKLANVVIQ